MVYNNKAFALDLFKVFEADFSKLKIKYQKNQTFRYFFESIQAFFKLHGTNLKAWRKAIEKMPDDTKVKKAEKR